jgi:hypothetical protein
VSGIPQPELPKPRPRRNVFAAAAATEKDQVSPEPKSAPIPQPATEGSAVTGRIEAAPRGSGGGERSKRPVNSKDILLSVPEDLKGRMEATIAHTYPYTGIKHQQAFIRQAISELCSKLEGQHNNGKRYQPPATPPDQN